MKRTLIAALLAMLAWQASPVRSDPVLSMYAGGNGIWFHDKARPADFEAGLTANASFSPHISGQGRIFYGFDNSYVRATLGPVLTATDSDNKNFSVGIGLEYQACTESAVRPQEWLGSVKLGWRPYPATRPRWIVGAEGALGLDTNESHGIVAVRYALTP